MDKKEKDRIDMARVQYEIDKKKEQFRIDMDRLQYEIDKKISEFSAIIKPKEHKNIFKIIDKMRK